MDDISNDTEFCPACLKDTDMEDMMRCDDCGEELCEACLTEVDTDLLCTVCLQERQE